MPAADTQHGKPARKVRRPKKPSTTSVARAQEQQYASQGQSVKKQATAQRKVRVRKQQLAKSKPAAGDAPQTRAKDTQRAQSFVKSEYRRQVASDKAKGIVKSPRIKAPYRPGTTVPPDVAERVKERGSAATHKASVAGRVAPVLKVLDQTTRPLHATAGAADAAITGKNVLRAAKRGIQNKDHTTFSKVLEHAGVKNKAIRGVAGFALDVGLDPTTYVTGGTASVARKAAVEGAEKTAKGATIKVAGKPIPGVAKATAKAGETGGKAVRKVVPEKTREAVRSVAADVNPNVAPVGVSKEANRKAIAATRAARGKVNAGNRAAVDLAHGIKRQIGEKNYNRVVDAIESGDTSTLPHGLAKHAGTLGKHLKAIREVQTKAGVKVPERKGYVPRKLTPEAIAAKGKKPEHVGGKGTISPGSSKARKETRPMSEVRAEKPSVYREDLHAVVGERMAEGTASAARADLAKEIGDLGRTVKRGEKITLTEREGLYRVKPGEALKEIKPEGKKFTQPGKPESKTKYVILNRELVKRAMEGTSPALQGPGIIKGVDKATGVFKRVALATPGFHVRNAIGDTFQGYVNQPGHKLAPNLVRARRVTSALGEQQKAARGLGQPKPSGKTLKTAKYGHVSYEDLADNLVKAGAARSGYTAGELRELSAASASAGGKVRRGLRKGRQAVGATKAGEAGKRALLNREDIPRLATAIHALQNGATYEEAARKVADVHFDYQHLTSFERNIARRVMPFYTWTARNIPFTAKNVVARPGKYANFQKVREEAAAASQPGQVDEQTKGLYAQLEKAGVKLPGGYAKYLTEWEQRNAGVPISVGGKKFTESMGLPLQDLNEFPLAAGKGQAQEYFQKAMSLFGPIPKNPIEYYSNFRFFFRDQIERDTSPYVSAPNQVAGLPQKIKDELGVKRIVDKKSGKTVWAWRGKTDYLAKQVPGLPNYAMQLATGGSDQRGKGTGGKVLGLFGLKSVPIDPVHNAVNLAYDRMAEIQKQLSGLRQQGIGKDNPTPEWRRLNDQLKITSQIAFQGKAAQGYKVLPKQGGPPRVRRGSSGFQATGSGGSGGFQAGGSSGAGGFKSN